MTFERSKFAAWTRGQPSDHEILLLWRSGNDTYDIGQKLWVPEFHIAGRLPRIIERDRQDQEWNFDRLRADA